MKRRRLFLYATMVAALLPVSSIAASMESAPPAMFGLHFGQSFDPAQALGQNRLIGGHMLYRVQPSQPTAPFRRYFVSVTPEHHRIYAVLAIGTVSTRAACRNEQARLLQGLQGLPGARVQTHSDLFGRRMTLVTANLQAVLECRWTTQSIGIRAAYVDRALMPSAVLQ